jgi:putative ABC transport system ATP-binding protein
MVIKAPSKDPNSGVALKLSSITKSFGKVSVLRGVDLELKSGERVALMGPSGSGKSTLLNCICGIEKVDSGEVRMAGRSFGDLNGNELEQLRRESIGYVFQSFHLLPTLTAFENIEFPAQLIGMEKKERMEKVQGLIESVGLTERATHLPDALSGGERQRVAIARALVHRPALVLADEPTGSLDTENGDQVLKLLKTLSIEHGVALLLVTHDHASTDICDRVISMRDGSLIS